MFAKALLTTVILGTSSLAAAQPGTWNHYDRDRDHRVTRYNDRDWFPVAQNISFFSRSQKRTPDQQFVHIGAERGSIGALMFEGTSGRTPILDVYVGYTDGSKETIPVNRVLMPGERVVVRLSREFSVKAIRVDTQPNYYGAARDQGTFSVLASS